MHKPRMRSLGRVADMPPLLTVLTQVPPRLQHDPYVLVLILVLWLCGGYIK